MKVFVLIVFLLTASVSAINITEYDENGIITKLAEFLKDISKKFSSKFPSYVIVHDYSTGLPKTLERSLQNMNGNDNGIIVLNAVGYNFSGIIEPYWFSWLEQPTSVLHQTNSIVFVLIFHTDTFETVIRYTAANVKIKTDQHYFVLLNQDDDYEYILDNEYLRNMRNKIMLTLDPETREVINLKSVCFYCDFGSPEIVQIGTIEDGTIKLEYPNIYPDFTKNLNGTFMSIGWIQYHLPEDMVYIRKYYKTMYPSENVMLEIGDYLNFHWMIVQFEIPPPGVGIDIPLPDGTWTGVIGSVFHGKSDMSCPRIFSAYALPALTYTWYPYSFEKFSFTARIPGPDAPYLAVVLPYALDMWVGILLSCFVGSFFFCLLLKFNFVFLQNPFPRDQKPPNLLVYSMRYMFSTLIEENPPLVPNMMNPRAFIIFWWLFSIVVICGYESKLISFLAYPNPETVPETFVDLYERPSWRVGMSTAHHPYFGPLTGGAGGHRKFTTIGSYLEPSGTLLDCIEKVVYEDFSCITLDSFLTMLSNTFIDKEGIVPINVHTSDGLPIWMTFSLPRYSILAPSVYHFSVYMEAAGLAQKVQKDYVYAGKVEGLKTARQFDRWHARSKVLNLGQMSGAFFVVVIFAWSLPSIIFLWELKDIKKAKRNKNV